MYCSNCGKQIKENISYCPYCGVHAIGVYNGQEDKLFYHLPMTDNRNYDIKVYSKQIVFSGDFWYLKDKEFYRNTNHNATANIENYLGIGYLNKRSYRKTLFFVIGGTILEVVKMIVDKVSDLVKKINNYLQWIGHEISLPEWLNYTVNTLVIICILLAIIALFSKKKVIEISFTDKRICIPQKSISNREYMELYQIIQTLRKQL